MIIVPIFAMIGRIVLLGSERLFIKRLEKYDSMVVASLFFLLASIFLLPSIVINNEQFTYSEIYQSRWSMVSSLVYAIGFYCYVYAIKLEDTSLIAPLYNSSLIWLFFLSYLFLEDPITSLRLFGAVLIFFGVFLLYPGSFHNRFNELLKSKGSLIMILGSFFLAIGRIIDTMNIEFSNPGVYAIMMNFFVGFYLLLPSIVSRKGKQIREIMNNNRKDITFAAFANGWSYLFLLIALQELPVTIAEPLSLISIFVTAYLGKKFLKEIIIHRIPGMITIIIGSILLFL
ncbi:MAG: DMT family transporter [Candidatus Heimdallarchaeota archaeon]|nr:DMT family transporter [Candidatus Heimdallarchaeota archaeon]MDH5646497.1 DMT family transporter [Candidatus Heimdallarchaeota archaeon]